MIHIAICDDDRPLTGTVEQLLLRIAAEHGIAVRCEVFFDGASLLRAVTEQQMCFDLIYLDIEMGDMNGIQTALALRKKELPMLIVYMSGHEEYWKELFCTEPFRFLSKPIDETTFRSVFLAARERIAKRSGYFTFFCKRARHRIPFDRIAYFESRGRIISICSSEKEGVQADSRPDRFYGKMNDIEEQVASMNGRFLRVHQSFLANFDYIKMLSSTEIEMLDGRKIPISEDRSKNVRAKFSALLDDKGE
ncbi:MAG: LytTR family DNA-binding domain-containing protein [Lachnospiraceae bacterium]|nr:LytTR family DNA-binding domain-containing protein [Lachnospiraceae bacterium]